MSQSKKSNVSNVKSLLCKKTAHDGDDYAPSSNVAEKTAENTSPITTANTHTSKVVRSDKLDNIQFYSACTLENLKNYAKNSMLRVRGSETPDTDYLRSAVRRQNSTSTNATTTATDDSSQHTIVNESPKYNTRSSSMHTQNKNKVNSTTVMLRGLI